MRTTTTGPGRAGDPVVEVHHDAATGTATYLVSDPATRRCALVDSVLGFDAGSGRTTTGAADRWIDRILGRGLVLEWILETHVHADHLSAAHYLKSRLGGRICVGAHVAAVRENFAAVFDDPGRAASGEGRFDHLFADGDEFRIGGVPVRVMHTPGHTPACVSYVVGEGGTDVFVGDTLFAPEAGTARCDFPGGDARVLFHSIQRLLALPDATRLHLCHDYPARGEAPRLASTVARQRALNIHVREGTDVETFVALRRARDATLSAPSLLFPALQVNLRAGQLPVAEANGVSYLRIPLNRF